MVKVEFTGSVEEVKKEIREFIEANCIEVVNSTEKAINKAASNVKTEEKTTVNVEEKKEEVKKVEEAPVEVATPLPTKTAEYTAADLQKIAAAWVNKDIDNNRVALVNLLSSFGVKAITVLPKENYGAFVQELKNLGADV